jgi:hypothetical protein
VESEHVRGSFAVQYFQPDNATAPGGFTIAWSLLWKPTLETHNLILSTFLQPLTEFVYNTSHTQSTRSRYYDGGKKADLEIRIGSDSIESLLWLISSWAAASGGYGARRLV